MSTHDLIGWHGRFIVAKFHNEDDLRRADPYDVIESDPNLLLTAGATAIFNRLANLGSVTAFDATNGRICVGDSATAVAAGQTDLQAATNKLRKVFDAAPTISTNSFTAVTTFAAGEGTFTWNELGVANHASAAVMLNRVVQSFGAKGAGATWVTTFIGTLS